MQVELEVNKSTILEELNAKQFFGVPAATVGGGVIGSTIGSGVGLLSGVAGGEPETVDDIVGSGVANALIGSAVGGTVGALGSGYMANNVLRDRPEDQMVPQK